ncbi:hypothetical protein QTQ03_00930 [Micromonospora sp. WMMA1363]|uniref:hypothetical protein n=1 Tax=Micromonospora sp. WMMA1363 TaxID=3053985 RepID=UPI00259C78A8|nr:hypothetical protein [Micromonospora sp. WMMA1363]MDM4718220.1 hypothetical protein [Micromonospora sp. WMMA1363]
MAWVWVWAGGAGAGACGWFGQPRRTAGTAARVLPAEARSQVGELMVVDSIAI